MPQGFANIFALLRQLATSHCHVGDGKDGTRSHAKRVLQTRPAQVVSPVGLRNAAAWGSDGRVLRAMVQTTRKGLLITTHMVICVDAPVAAPAEPSSHRVLRRFEIRRSGSKQTEPGAAMHDRVLLEGRWSQHDGNLAHMEERRSFHPKAFWSVESAGMDRCGKTGSGARRKRFCANRAHSSANNEERTLSIAPRVRRCM